MVRIRAQGQKKTNTAYTSAYNETLRKLTGKCNNATANKCVTEDQRRKVATSARRLYIGELKEKRRTEQDIFSEIEATKKPTKTKARQLKLFKLKKELITLQQQKTKVVHNKTSKKVKTTPCVQFAQWSFQETNVSAQIIHGCFLEIRFGKNACDSDESSIAEELRTLEGDYNSYVASFNENQKTKKSYNLQNTNKLFLNSLNDDILSVSLLNSLKKSDINDYEFCVPIRHKGAITNRGEKAIALLKEEKINLNGVDVYLKHLPSENGVKNFTVQRSFKAYSRNHEQHSQQTPT